MSKKRFPGVSLRRYPAISSRESAQKYAIHHYPFFYERQIKDMTITQFIAFYAALEKKYGHAPMGEDL